MTKKIVWRLSSRPTAEELRELVNAKIITQEEAREILFSKEEVDERNNKSFESEIKFLRDLVEKLSKSDGKLVEVIRTVEKPYHRYDWYGPYNNWCTSPAFTYCDGSTLTVTAGHDSIVTDGSDSTGVLNTSFSDIKTF